MLCEFKTHMHNMEFNKINQYLNFDIEGMVRCWIRWADGHIMVANLVDAIEVFH